MMFENEYFNPIRTEQEWNSHMSGLLQYLTEPVSLAKRFENAASCIDEMVNNNEIPQNKLAQYIYENKLKIDYVSELNQIIHEVSHQENNPYLKQLIRTNSIKKETVIEFKKNLQIVRDLCQKTEESFSYEITRKNYDSQVAYDMLKATHQVKQAKSEKKSVFSRFSKRAK
jgi:hypothetical protein